MSAGLVFLCFSRLPDDGIAAPKHVGVENLHELYFMIRMLPFIFIWRNGPTQARASSFTRFLDHIQWRATVARTPLDAWSARRRDLYLATHNIHDRQTSMSPVGFEPTLSAGERPQTHALDRAATGTGLLCCT